MSGERVNPSYVWNNTIRSLELAVFNLELFEGEPLVDESLSVFNKLLTLGQTFEEVSTYRSQNESSSTAPNTSNINRYLDDQNKVVSAQWYGKTPISDTELMTILNEPNLAIDKPSEFSQTRLSYNKPTSDEYNFFIKKWESEFQQKEYWKLPKDVEDIPFEEENDKLPYIPEELSDTKHGLYPFNVVMNAAFQTYNHYGYKEQQLPSSHDTTAFVIEAVASPSVKIEVDVPQHIDGNQQKRNYWPTEQEQQNTLLYNPNYPEATEVNFKGDDNRLEKTEHRDTMEIPFIHGPRLINPKVDQIHSNDGSQYNEESNIDRIFNDTRVRRIESFPSFVDSIALYTDVGPSELLILNLDDPKHLEMVQIPPSNTEFTVVICYHIYFLNQNPVLKGLQLYVSTGESYTVHVEKACPSDTVKETFKNTMIGRLLTDPSIKRVCWRPEHIQQECKKKLGCGIGKCTDLSKRAGYGRERGFRFVDAVNYFLNDWDIKDQFEEAKAEYDEKMNRRTKSHKFKVHGWDLVKLPENILRFSALHGLTTYQVYAETLKEIKIDDAIFQYIPDDTEV